MRSLEFILYVLSLSIRGIVGKSSGLSVFILASLVDVYIFNVFSVVSKIIFLSSLILFKKLLIMFAGTAILPFSSTFTGTSISSPKSRLVDLIIKLLPFVSKSKQDKTGRFAFLPTIFSAFDTAR